MNKQHLKGKVVFACALSALGTAAHAQSSVTLFGVIDSGLNYTNNAGGHSGFQMVSGDANASRWGVRGSEDLGGGLKAIFKLENGFNAFTGTLGQGGREFGRQAYVGLSSDKLGTLTLGRQYDAMLDMWSPFAAAGWSIGDLSAHPFDNDNADWDYRTNNSVKYVSPSYRGLQAEAMYGFSNEAGGFENNRSYSAGLTYTMGGLSAAVAYVRTDNPGTTTGGAVGYDNLFVAASQRNLGAAVRWTFANNANIALAYSHVLVEDPLSSAYVSNPGTQNWRSWRFDNFEVNGQYFFTPALSAAASYTYTTSSFKTATGSNSPDWHQVALMVDYALSKRTSAYVQGAWQHANGNTGTGFDQAQIVGSAGESSSGNQMVYRVGLMHRF
ncbi:porin [Caballeronia sp. GAFFF2]|uniref:porin n=1 Tax=Caballeronia sp. GAFFF2 TaxID=2921741 RepID=UPI00202955BB|nr:porin [Caballeronia sp. GAFFF2]